MKASVTRKSGDTSSTHIIDDELKIARSIVLGGQYQLLVIPLLVETAGRTPVDRVLVVDCSETLQIRRLQARDGATLEQARQILSAQVSREVRLAAANDVILNEGDLVAVRDRVAELHRLYVKLAAAAARQAPT